MVETATKETHTLLGEWLEKTRAGREQTLYEAVDAIGVSLLTVQRLRAQPPQWIATTTKERFADYLNVEPRTVELLASIEIAGPLLTHDRRARQDRIADDLSRLAHAIDVARRERAQSLGDVAREIGIDPSSLSRIRTVGASMYRSTMRGIAEYLGADVDEIERWARQPAPKILELPVTTVAGTKYHPTIDVGGRSCARCPFREPCRRDVMERDGFAWCEELIPADFKANGKNYRRHK